MTDINARKEVLRKSGRCYICLRKHHISRDCRSSGSCSKCRGRHHVTICPRASSRANDSPPGASPGPTPEGASRASGSVQVSTSTMYVDSQMPVLLQMARLQLFNFDDVMVPPNSIEVSAIVDSRSQRTYVTSRMRESMHLPVKRTETLSIKTFGSTEGQDTVYEAVELGLITKNGESLKLTALVVPFICNPLTSQPINQSRDHYNHLVGLKLVDSANLGDVLEVAS